jgi:long-subunit acyl-CoA synthetase (AMP-forming)
VVGAIVVPINAWLPLDSLIHCITLTNCRVLFVDLERAHVLSPSIPQLQLHRVIVFQAASVLASLSLEGMMSFDTALLSVKGKTIVPEVTIDPEDMACIFFTSGTSTSLSSYSLYIFVRNLTDID